MTPIAPLIEAFLDETLVRQRGVEVRGHVQHRPFQGFQLPLRRRAS